MAFLSEYGHLTEPLAGQPLWLKAVETLGGGLIFYVLYAVYRHHRWPNYTLPGPAYQSLLGGSTPKPEPPDFSALYLHQGWFRKYGPTLRYWSPLAKPAIMTVDPTALKHMLNSPAYEKPDTLKHFLGDILGEGMCASVH